MVILSLTAFGLESAPVPTSSQTDLKQAAFSVLQAKCNVCHRKQNPFMVFNQRNMEKRAKRIYQAVFVEGRMPKGNEVSLTPEEYDAIRQWLTTVDLK